ncbi:transmembrane protein, putative [Medicago truncatula]|uniref:Transmembrane protein, putative n=1 Tax=Medicago truncatula TaxID=3880 RepID=A0A072TXL4_MEDTR|nr:transmembrane protein, putative [Medicago truncatula]
MFPLIHDSRSIRFQFELEMCFGSVAATVPFARTTFFWPIVCWVLLVFSLGWGKQVIKKSFLHGLW